MKKVYDIPLSKVNTPARRWLHNDVARHVTCWESHFCSKICYYKYPSYLQHSSLVYPITLQGGWGSKDGFTTLSCHLFLP